MRNLILQSLAVIAILSVAWVFDYFALPVWNWSSLGFWGYLISVLSIGVILFIVADKFHYTKLINRALDNVRKKIQKGL